MLLTQIGIHDKEVEVLLQVTAVFGNLSSEQVEYSSQQVVTQTEVITALIHKHGSSTAELISCMAIVCQNKNIIKVDLSSSAKI